MKRPQLPLASLATVALLLGPGLLSAQQPTVELWVRDQLTAILPAPHDPAKQRDSPAADTRSTSLVDNSSAPSLLSVAATLVPLASNLSPAFAPTSSGSGTATGTFTVSLFSLEAAVQHRQPLEPGFYQRGVNARRLFFTAGSASSVAASDNTAAAAAVLGAKFLVLNGRDIGTTHNQKLLADLAQHLKETAPAYAKMLADVRLLFLKAVLPGSVKPGGAVDFEHFPDAFGIFAEDRFPEVVHSLAPADLAPILDRIAAFRDSEFALREHILQSYDKISQGPQLSAAYTANLRSGVGYNTHRGEVVFDLGLTPRVSWTANSSADWTDRKSAGSNSIGGRFATEFQASLTQPPATSAYSPVVVAFSGQGVWATAQKPGYSGQVKVSIPIAPGIDLPVAYRYANRVAQLDQSDSSGLLGISFDLARFLPRTR